MEGEKRIFLDVFFGENSLKEERIAKWTFFYSGISTFFLLLSHFSQVNLSRQALIFSFVMLSLTYESRTIKSGDFSSPTFAFLGLLVGTGILTIFKISCYSYFGVVCSLSLLSMLIDSVRKKRKIVKTIIFLSVLFLLISSISFILLAEEGKIHLPLEKALLPTQVILITLLCYSVFFTYSEYIWEVKPINWPIWILSPSLVLISAFMSAIGIVLSFHCNQHLFLTIIVIKDVLGALCFFIFPEQIAIFTRHSFYFSMETGYRVHQRQFTRRYQAKTCDKQVEWEEEECVLCNKKATMIFTTCGHLTVCKPCYIRSKEIKECFICKKKSEIVQEVQFRPSDTKYGYQKKFFIEKKLRKNEYVIQQ